jgi:hypothetical protein
MTISSLLCKHSSLSLAHAVIPSKITRIFNMTDTALKLPKDVRETLSAINKDVVTETISIISPCYDHVIVDLGAHHVLVMSKSITRLMVKTPFLVTQRTMGSTSGWFTATISGSSYCTVENVPKPKLWIGILPPTLAALFLMEFLKLMMLHLS